ncbi:hypothetical protein [Streptomyces canus]|uniref:hypothetical protein n=1 Tax=Streptomyces canus TaxID=58343 RepID=UPI00386D6648|nr:hypothetical protein OH824_17730 [Streptomyces canus]
MKLYFVRIDPVQEIAAERATLDLLRDILRPKEVEPRATPEFLTAARTCGWPLVYDDSITHGIVLCRPTPGAAPAPTAEELEQYLQAFMSGRRSDS